MEPLDLLARLAALVPAPRRHALRYHGTLAPNSKCRARIVPVQAGPAVAKAKTIRSRGECPADRSVSAADHEGSASVARLSWAELMLRVFKVDVLECPRCKGRLRIIATVTAPSAVKAILMCLGLPARPPTWLLRGSASKGRSSLTGERRRRGRTQFGPRRRVRWMCAPGPA